MENWENKLLADKLDSLQEFPAGYAPDLSSKWEIVEAGLPPQKKQRIAPIALRWSAVAAGLLTIVFVWMNNTATKKADIVHTKPILSQPALLPVIQDSHQNDMELTVQQQLPQKALPAIVENSIVPAKKTEQKEPDKLQQKTIAQQNTELINPSQNLPDTTPIQINNEVAVVPTAEIPKSAKRKVYQRDFNDNVFVIDSGFSSGSSQHFSIKLLPFGKRNIGSNEQPTNRLQLKQVL